LAAFFATVMRFLGHSLLASFSPLLSILYRGGVVFVAHKVACVLKGSLLGFLYMCFLHATCLAKVFWEIDLVWQNVPENNLDRLPQWWGPSGAAAAPNIHCFVELENPLLYPAPLLQQTSFHSVHYFCSQINTITNDPSKVTCWNKEETTICHFKLDCFINNFSFGTRFTNELKRVPQLCYSNETKKKKHIKSLARTHARTHMMIKIWGKFY